MLARQQLTDLASRRQLLVKEAELHRSVVLLERENLRAQLARLKQAPRQAASHPLLMAGSAVAGLFALRHWRKLARWIPVAFTLLRSMQSLRRRS